MKKKILNRDRFAEAIKTACEGLHFPSETDAEIIPVFGKHLVDRSREAIVKELGLEDDGTAEERSFEELFSRLTKTHDWFTRTETTKAKRFVRLQKLLEENLKYLTVLRSGRIQIAIYIVGIDSDGNLAGIKTMAVET